jgi:RimJ/RimL family protein N-acetyltransferase
MPSLPPRDPIPVLADLPVAIDTPRLHLRPQRETDAETLFRYTSDPELTPFVTWATHREIEETRAWLRSGTEGFAAGKNMIWTIEHAGDPCGAISLLGITWALRAVRWDRAELGYWIGRPLWGKGLMTEAAVAVTHWAFETLGLHRVTVGCIDENVGSRRVIEKVGFRFLCKQDEDVWKDGRWLNHLRYELTAAEWADSTRTLRFTRPA